MSESAELERALDELLSQLGGVYVQLSGRLARTQFAASELEANNRRLKALQRQAEEATRAATQRQQVEDSEGTGDGKAEAEVEEEEAEVEVSVPAVSNIEEVLAQARAIRGNEASKTAAARGVGSRVASNTGGPVKRAQKPGQRGGTAAATGPSLKRGPSRGAVSQAGNSSSSSSGRAAKGKETAGSSGSCKGQQAPQSSAAALPPLPARPRLPKRLLLALKRLPSQDTDRVHVPHQQSEQHWTAPIDRAARSFQATLASGFQVPSVQEREAEQWRSSLRVDHDDGPGSGDDKMGEEHRRAWLGAHGVRWVRALALAEAQQSLARKLDTIAAEPNGLQLSELRDCIKREWEEMEAEAARMELQVPFQEAVRNMAKWRNRGMRMLLAGGETAPATAMPQRAERPPPAEVWLPPKVLQYTSGLLQKASKEYMPSSLAGDRLWEELLFPSSACMRRDGRRAELVYHSPQQVVSLAKARHQLQLYLLQIYLESGPALALLPTHSAPAPLRTGEEAGAECERYAARVRLAHAFLCCGLDRGLCTISYRTTEGDDY